MGGLEQVEEVVHGLAVDAVEFFGKRGHVEDAAVMVGKVEEDFFDLQHPADAVEGRHVAFEHLVHDVLAQEALAAGEVVDHGRLREAAAQEVFVEVGGERAAKRGGV